MDAILRFPGRIPLSAAAVATAALLGLSACGGSAKPTPTITPAPTPTHAPLTPTPMVDALGQIVWAQSVDPATGAPVQQTTSFAPGAPTIYAVVAVKNVTPGLTLTASWRYNGAELKNVGATVVAAQPMASGWIEFHLSQAPGELWPVGTYQVTIAQPGAPPVTASVEVKRPAA